MTTIFLPKDRLLGSSGVVPVYYWFVRSVSEKKRRNVREFLLSFERLRKENRLLSEQQPQSRQIEKDLAEFDNLNRSTNDQVSHERRFRILQQRFLGFDSPMRGPTT
jgi:hypothetical protein